MERALTIGVAGHVDHGKTTLVRQLTGVETDRLGEEKRRGISIELGFAPLTLDVLGQPVRIGFVDMPGHERFVRRMISGAAGIDAVLLVVAADEGVMPQGREHLAICELLGVQQGAIVLTKVDMADELLTELVAEDVQDLVTDTALDGAPILQFSAMEPDRWLPQLKTQLGELAAGWLSARQAQRSSRAMMPFRLPIDRSFVLPGRGTIVTGTAAAGQIETGMSLAVHPGSLRFRVRGLQRHGADVTSFVAPGRVALDLAGATAEEVPVGAVLAADGALLETDRIDAKITTLTHLKRPLKLRQRALVHLGTTHVEAAITQLSGEPLLPGETAFVQLHLDRPLAVAGGERFIVRSSSVDPRHGQTIAGGQVLHPAPARHRLGDARVLTELDRLSTGDGETRVAAMVALARDRGLNEAELAQHLDLPAAAIAKAVKSNLARGRLRRFGKPPRYLSPLAVESLEQRAQAAVDRSHTQMPDRPGLDEAELTRQIGQWLDPQMTGALVATLIKRGVLVRVGKDVARPDFKPKRLTARKEVHEAITAVLGHADDLAVPIGNAFMTEVSARSGSDADEIALAVREGVASGQLVQIRAGFVLPSARLNSAIESVFQAFSQQERFTTGELKEVLGLSRKHLIPVAEYLDGQRLTVRDPDGNRRFRAKALQAWLARN
ncbi:MAG: selenocysteine-specific translation elongation factor [Myxococcales bacterium]|nr:selenocysteine-specific translation elongation factor [Myxococcales bacterium]